MPKRTSKKQVKVKKPKDINILAKGIIDKATKEPSKGILRKKNPAAVALGKLGGLKGGRARAMKLTKEERIEIASNAAKVRWRKEGKQ